MSTNTTAELEAAKKAFTAAKERLEKAQAAEAEKAKNEFSDELIGLHTTFLTIPDAQREKLWKDRELAKIAKKLGLQAIPAKEVGGTNGDSTSTRKSRSEVSAHDVYEFVKASGKVTIGQVNRHFEDKASKVTIGKLISELEKQGKITKTRAEKGNQKYLQIV